MLTDNAYAKINLTLDVVGKRPDGYHLLETVMQSISLCDRVSVEKSDSPNIVISSNATDIPNDARNTCYKAAECFFRHTKIHSGVRIFIDKAIPSEAGLGGGSSDAAATLRLLNEAFSASLSTIELEQIAAEVGADVTFCVRGGTAVCRGVGEKIERLAGLPKRYVLLIKPDFGVSTPEAYSLFDIKNTLSAHGTAAFLSALTLGENPYTKLTNDLETALENPKISVIEQALISSGAECAQMTGSGSCVFGLFTSQIIAEKARIQLEELYPFVCLCETI